MRYNGSFAAMGLVGIIGFSLLGNRSGMSAPPKKEGEFDARLKEVAKEYRTWGRVDDQNRLVLSDCSPPAIPSTDGTANWSEIDKPVRRKQEQPTRKTYFHFAKDRNSYLRSSKQANPVGQVIVRELWEALEVDTSSPSIAEMGLLAGNMQLNTRPGNVILVPNPNTIGNVISVPNPTTVVNPIHIAGRFGADKLAQLFVMMKLSPNKSEMDEGWVYAVMTPERRLNFRVQSHGPNDPKASATEITLDPEVTSAGKVATCMRCHAKAPGDRLFGFPGLTK
jgi:hypothetical protein